MTRRRRSKPRGQAMVEFALVAPLFFLLLFAIIEGARFVFYNEMLNNATREGARYAIVHGANTQAPGFCDSGPPAPGTEPGCDPAGNNVIGAVEAAAIGIVNSGDLTVYPPLWCALPDAPDPAVGCIGNNGRGNYVTVFVDYTYTPLVPILPSITISARSSLVINN